MSSTQSRPSAGSPAAGASLAAVVLLLGLSLATGGSSQEPGAGALATQVLAVPALGWAGWQLLQGGRLGRLAWAWLASAAMLMAIPLLQLLPMQAGGEARAALASDLALFGVAVPSRVSVLPSATAGAAMSLLPALAVFALTLGLPASARRWLPTAIAGLALASLLLGLAQLGAPRESVLNPYPQWTPAMGGFFANPNHQATLLVVAATLATAGVLTALGSWLPGRPHRGPVLVGWACTLLVTLVALPLTGSRAGLILGVVACALVMVALLPGWSGPRTGRALLVAAATVAGLGLLAAIRWMRSSAVDELRSPLRSLAVEIGERFAPLGSGMGSFVPVFEQEAPAWLLMGEYVNHAHNEYAQWWLEGGVPALLAMLLVAALLALSLRSLLRQPADARAPGLAALVALGAVLAHSVVDYPLRTPALVAIAAALAGVVAGQAVQGGEARNRAGRRGVAASSHRLQGDMTS